MNYNEALEYIHSTLWKGSRLGLVRMTELAAKIGNPQKGMKFVHIAGTNGKGSTAAMLAAVFLEAGYKTGLFTSPYVTSFNERIQINSTPISDSDLAFETACINPFAESMEDCPTEFELVTAIALSYFKRMDCDIVILEVGLGGELDSTNVIDVPELAIITAIGMDHMSQLGDTIDEIARAKAGIIKRGGKVIAYGGDSSPNSVIESTCREKGAQLVWAHFEALTPRGFMENCQLFDYGQYKNLELSLLGDFQLNNSALVLGAVEILRNAGWNISENALRRGLKTAHWPGRFEMLIKEPPFLLDGAHNPHGTAAAAKSLKSMFPDRKFIFLTGVMEDKDIDGLFTPLLPIAKTFVTVPPDNPRAMDSDKLAETLKSMGAEAFAKASIEEGVHMSRKLAGDSVPVCAIGSLYMAGTVRDIVSGASDPI